MDEICIDDNSEFQLQVQQKFLRKFVIKNPGWKKLLLYHQVGSGKTCTAISIAEEYLIKNPENRISVILPARLRSNFIDELISPCGLETYLSSSDFIKYKNVNTAQSEKDKVRKKFMGMISEYYDLLSFERFRIDAVKERTNLKQWAVKFTKNRLIIIDEVHNLLSSSYDEVVFEEVLRRNALPVLPTIKGINTILLKYLMNNAHETCKFLFLTATPIFDNLAQFKELVWLINPKANIHDKSRILDVIHNLKGYVSYYPGISVNAYPKLSYITHNVIMSELQERVISIIKSESGDEHDPEKEAFMIKERQACIACLPGRAPVSDNIERVLDNLPQCAPKLIELLTHLRANSIGKHMIYSTFIQAGLNVVEELLKREGWISYNKAKVNEALWKMHHYKVYANWDGSTNDKDKQDIKNTVNSKDNIDGRLVRVILGSPSIREGVSLKHIQHIHLLDPVWNSSAKDQLEGRAVRFCSHVDIPANHPILKREVLVHIYQLVHWNHDNIQVVQDEETVMLTADHIIYNSIIPYKRIMISAAELALKKIALDRHLFRNLHTEQKVTRQDLENKFRDEEDNESVLSLDLEDNHKLAKSGKSQKRKKKTCPKKRRPDQDGNCPPGQFIRPNKHGELCCYKKP
jgi:hypothetical protein